MVLWFRKEAIPWIIFPIDLSTWPRGQMFYYFMLIGFNQLKKYIVI